MWLSLPLPALKETSPFTATIPWMVIWPLASTEMPGEQRTQLLSAMDSEDADVLRRLLAYEEGTAGSLMTPDVIILGPLATVAPLPILFHALFVQRVMVPFFHALGALDKGGTAMTVSLENLLRETLFIPLYIFE